MLYSSQSNDNSIGYRKFFLTYTPVIKPTYKKTKSLITNASLISPQIDFIRIGVGFNVIFIIFKNVIKLLRKSSSSVLVVNVGYIIDL